TSAQLCAAQPSARSPRTAAQAAALGAASQVDSCRPDCGQVGETPANKAIAAANEYVRILKSIMTSSRLQQMLDANFFAAPIVALGGRLSQFRARCEPRTLGAHV